MRSVVAVIVFLASLAGTQAFAGQPGAPEKVKTGILPSGEFYSLYNVTCSDGRQESVSSLQRGTRWCTEHAGELACFRRSTVASQVACMSSDVAASIEDLDRLDAFQ